MSVTAFFLRDFGTPFVYCGESLMDGRTRCYLAARIDFCNLVPCVLVKGCVNVVKCDMIPLKIKDRL